MRPLTVLLLALALALLAPGRAAADEAPLPAPAVPPLAGPVTRGFDAPDPDWLPGHRGVDLAGSPGEAVRATAAGVVVVAGELFGRGVVVVSHGAYRTTYEPVVASVSVGDAVGPGDVIGTLGAGHDGCPVDACLHWGLKRGDAYVDPLLLLRDRRVRLVPLGRAPAPPLGGVPPTRPDPPVASSDSVVPPSGDAGGPLRPAGAPGGTRRAAAPW